MEKLAQCFASGVKWTSVSTIISTFAKLIQVIVLTRFLSKSDFGVIGVALMCIGFSEIFLDLGISSGVMHVQNITKRQYSSLFWINVFTGVVVYLIFAGLSPLIAIYYKEDVLNKVLPLIFLIIIISSLFRLQRTIQFKEMRFKFIAITEISSNIIMLAFSVLFAILGWGVYSLVWSTVIFYLYLAIIYLSYSFIYLKNISFHFSPKDLKPFLKIGVYQLGNSLVDTLSSEMDTIIIGRFFSMEILGVYTLCKQLANRIYGFINPIITKVLTPALASIQNDINQVRQKYMQVLYILAAVNIPIYVFVIYLSPQVLTILYGDQYAEYYLVLILLCINYGMLSVGNPIGSLQVALGRTDLGFYWTIYRVFAYTIALSLGAMSGNFDICILSLVIMQIINFYPGNRMLLRKMIGIGLLESLDVYRIPLFISLALSFVCFVHLFELNDYVGIIVCGIVFFPIYIIMLRKFQPQLVNSVISIIKKN